MDHRRILYVILFLLCRAWSVASESDSLRVLLQRTATYTPAHAKLLYQLGKSCLVDSPELATTYALTGLKESRHLNLKSLTGNILNLLGMIHMIHHRPTKAIEYYQQSLKLRQELNDSDEVAWTYNNLGLAYGDAGNYQMSAESHTRAIEIRRLMHDTVGLEAGYGKRGNAYLLLGELPSAMQDFLNLTQIAQAAGDKVQIATGYLDMGAVYDQMGNYQEALNYYNRAAHGYSEAGDKESMLRTYRCLGDIALKQGDDSVALKQYQDGLLLGEKFYLSQYEIFDIQKKTGQIYLRRADYLRAEISARKALTIAAHLNNKYLQAEILNLLGNIYQGQGRLNEALTYQNQSLALARETNTREILVRIEENLAQIYATMNDYRNAYKYEVQYKKDYDSVFSKENERKIATLQMQYNFKNQRDSLQLDKDIKIAAANQRIKQQEFYTAAGVIALIFLLSLLLMLYYNYLNQRRATSAMAIARERAEQGERVKQRFLANMSHEIRTPMNAIMGMANLALDTTLNEKQQGYINAIRKSAEDLLVIINGVLDLSRLESDKMKLEKLNFNLYQVVNHVIELMQLKADRHGLDLQLAIDESVPEMLNGDPARLKQVLLNLLGNAIKFTPSGQVSLRIRNLSLADQAPLLEFEVSDTGIGMTAEQQQTIFESFVQADSDTSRKYGGTGLGLAISKTIIEIQGGSISVQSEPGRGSTFVFTVPYAAAAEPLFTPEPHPDAHSLADLSILRVLIAEDNLLNQAVIKDTLELLAPGIEIDLATNGLEAIKMCQLYSYDVILMDVQMPEMDGCEATRFIRSSLHAQTPIIALTANVISEDIRKCMDAGMNGYIPKPFKRKDLLDGISKVVKTPHAWLT